MSGRSPVGAQPVRLRGTGHRWRGRRGAPSRRADERSRGQVPRSMLSSRAGGILGCAGGLRMVGAAVGQHGGKLVDGLHRLLRATDLLEEDVPDEGCDAGDHDQDQEDDEERQPAPHELVEQFGQEEKKKKKLEYSAITPATISRPVPAPAFLASPTSSALARATSDRNSVETLAVASLTRLPILGSPFGPAFASDSGIEGTESRGDRRDGVPARFRQAVLVGAHRILRCSADAICCHAWAHEVAAHPARRR